MEKLIIGYFEGELEEAEKKELLNKIKSDPETKKLFFEWKLIYDTEKISGIKTNYSLNTEWEKFSEKNYSEFTKAAKSFKINQLLKYAAILIIGAGLSIGLYTNINDFKTETQVAENEIYVPKGQKSQLTLSDGTRIWLNSETTLTYPATFQLKSRTVKLEGEAYFEVSHNKKIPFIVQTEGVDVKVLGTSFNVKTYPNENTIETTLIEGKVSLLKSDKRDEKTPVLLSPNQKAIFNKANANITIQNLEEEIEDNPSINQTSNQKISNPESVISWKEDVLSFDNESLEQIAHKLERWYGYKVIIKDPELFEHCYMGRFENFEPIQQVLDVIKITTPINYTIENRNVIIYKN